MTREEINAVLGNLCGLHFGFESGLIGYTDSEKFYLDAEDCRRYGEAFTAAARLMSPQTAIQVMGKEHGVSNCARVAYDAVYSSSLRYSWNGITRKSQIQYIANARRVLAGKLAKLSSFEESDKKDRPARYAANLDRLVDFTAAVLTEARRLVSSGECSVLADYEAMK